MGGQLVQISGDTATGRVAARWADLNMVVNILANGQQDVANRFAGIGGIKGVARYEGASWTTLVSGAPVLVDALAAIDCEVEEVIERHSHAIILGRALAVLSGDGESLVYHNGGYGRVSR